jgi:hypothetical protein
MSNMTLTTIHEKVQENLDQIQLDLDSSTEYSKPKAGTIYVIEIDLENHPIETKESDKFKDATGKPLKQYQFIIKHTNNNIEQKWNVSSKTLVRQLYGANTQGVQNNQRPKDRRR